MGFILLIEDEPNLLRAIARMIRADGHDVAEARGGQEGLRLLKNGPDIIVTDILMPTTDGIEIMAANRALRRPAKLIAMTGAPACGQMDYLTIARSLGADATLRKPFRRADIQAAIETCWSGTRSVEGRTEAA